MRHKPSLNETFFKAPIIAFFLLLVLALSTVRPFIAQTRTDARDRQLQQLEQIDALPVRAKRFAVIIGVDNYEDTQITTLGGATNDAKAIADALIHYAGFPADQVILLASDQPVERQPTRGNILRRLSNLRRAVPKDGMLLVSFAGHGIEREGHVFLLPADAQVSGDVRLLEETTINVTRMREAIKETGVGQVMLMLDACRNDPVGRASADNPLTPAYTRGFDFDVRNKEVLAFVTLYATAVGQRAYEFKEKKQGYFSWEFVEALKGGAANEKGEITLASLISYLQAQVPKRVRIDLGKEQHPFAVVEGYKAEELVIAAPVSTLSARARPASQPVDPATVELSYWELIKNSTNPEDFKAYLSEYPHGRFASLARIRAQQTSPQPAAKRRANGGKVILWTSVVKNGNQDSAFAILDEFTMPFSNALRKANLNVTKNTELDSRTFDQILGMINLWGRGENVPVRSIPFDQLVDATITLNDLAPYNGIYVSVVKLQLNAIDMNSGQSIAVEYIAEAKGFGNKQEQARRNALKEAAASVSESFLNKVAGDAQ